MRLKNISQEKSDLFAYFRFCACKEKKNRKVSTIEMLVPLNHFLQKNFVRTKRIKSTKSTKV